MLIPPFGPVSPSKAVWREKMRAERRAAAAARPDAARHAAAALVAALPLPDGATVALYHPIGDELDTEPLFDALTARGIAVALPATPRGRKPLDFRRFAPGDALEPDRHGVMTPAAGAERVRPDIIVCPLLAFTRAGDRLGYGGGYYDRTLAMLRAEGPVIAVGYGYGVQEVDALPAGPHDQPMDWLATERGCFRAERRMETR